MNLSEPWLPARQRVARAQLVIGSSVGVAVDIR